MFRHLKRRALAVTAVLLAMAMAFVLFAAPSQAAFALTCNLNSVAQGRWDFPSGFTYSNDHSKVDTSAIRWRAINRTTGTTAAWRADAFWVQLWNEDHTGGPAWENWTTRGGTADDSSDVAPDYTWDPSAKNGTAGGPYYSKLRARVWENGYFCNTPEVSF